MNANLAPDIVTGAEYVRQITALESDRLARSAFQRLVLSLAPAGARIFDFGAGPGIDARFYAERNRSVAAYDIDPRMCEYFAGYCGELIDAGRIRLERGEYADFLARLSLESGCGIDLITSNFAPLNLVDDLRGLFTKFHALTAPHGKVLASVLSPYFIGDLKYGWWWRNLPRLWRQGSYSVRGAQASIFRRRLADFAAQSAPHFALTRAYPGLPAELEREPTPVDVSGHAPGVIRHLSRCRFMFLLFEKR